jgi:hypothetical protein
MGTHDSVRMYEPNVQVRMYEPNVPQRFVFAPRSAHRAERLGYRELPYNGAAVPATAMAADGLEMKRM